MEEADLGKKEKKEKKQKEKREKSREKRDEGKLLGGRHAATQADFKQTLIMIIKFLIS